MKLSNEARVGLMVTVSFTVFLILVGLLAKINVSQSGYKLRLYFGFLNDLRVTAPVKIAGGITIGQVEMIRQTGEKTEVILWIDNRYKLIKSSTFAIFTSGLIGEKYINVIVPPIKDQEEFLADGDVKYGVDPASFDLMMQTFQGFMQDKSGGQILAEIFQNSNKFVESLNAIANENRYDIKKTVDIFKALVANISVQSKVMIDQINLFTKNMAELSEKNKEDISITLRNLSESTDKMNKVFFRIEKGRGTLGKLLNDEEVYNNIRDASIFAKDLFYILKKNPSKLWYGSSKHEK
jgi:phospholipid/cholesterol/gamma-HCH transport system substrate-binding protein